MTKGTKDQLEKFLLRAIHEEDLELAKTIAGILERKDDPAYLYSHLVDEAEAFIVEYGGKHGNIHDFLTFVRWRNDKTH